MNKLLQSAAFAIVLSFTSCKQDTTLSANNSPTSIYSNTSDASIAPLETDGNGLTLVEIDILKERFDSNNRVIEEIYQVNGKESGKIVYMYDEKGNLREKKSYKGTILESRDTFKYDSSSRVIEEEHYNSDRLIVRKKKNYKGAVVDEYHYNNKGELIVEIGMRLNGEGKVEEQFVYERGKLTESKGFEYDLGGQDFIVTSRFDDEGKTIFEESVYQTFDGRRISAKLFEDREYDVDVRIKYDDFGQEIERIDADGYGLFAQYNERGDVIETRKEDVLRRKLEASYKYEYDTAGRKLSCVVTDRSSLKISDIRWAYNPDGSLKEIIKEDYNKGLGGVQFHTTKKYDNRYRVIEEAVEENGIPKWRTKWTYNKAGKQVQTKHYSKK